MSKKTNSSLKKLIIVVLIILFALNTYSLKVEAVSTVTIEPEDNQYFELKATTINDIEGQGKQVIMELWGHEIDFKRNGCKVQV